MAQINIMVSRHSAFYAPLIATIAAGFLKDEGLDPAYSAQTRDRTVFGGLRDGSLDIGQSAVRTHWMSLKRGEVPDVVHFAQINERDGFFIAGREPDPTFTWHRLIGRKVLVDHGDQPLAMFKYACHKKGVDFSDLDVVDAGGTDEIDQAFRTGTGDFVHQQGPAPQQLEKDGVGCVLASVGEAIGPVAFSSLVARKDWLGTDAYAAFMRAYLQSRAWVLNTAATDISAVLRDFFPNTDRDVLARTIGTYQGLGCWSADPRISRESYEAALDVFIDSGDISTRYPFEEVVPALSDAV